MQKLLLSDNPQIDSEIIINTMEYTGTCSFAIAQVLVRLRVWYFAEFILEIARMYGICFLTVQVASKIRTTPNL